MEAENPMAEPVPEPVAPMVPHVVEVEGRSLMKRPADFTGTNVEGFLLKTALYVEGNPSKFPTEKSCVIFTLSLMEGKAAIWAENFVEEVMTMEPHDYGTTEDLARRL